MSYRPLLITWLLMMLVLGISIGATVLVPGAIQQGVSLAAATAIAALIVAQFMGLRSAAGVIRLFALGGLFWLAFLFIMTTLDMVTR